MIVRILCVILLFGAGSIGVRAQTAVSDSHAQFLIVLDTSASMSRLSKSCFESISNLVAGGIQGQLHAGDTLSAWSFSETILTNRYGPVYWDPLLNQATANGILKQFKSQRFDKKTRYAPLWTALKQYAKEAGAFTAIIVTDGDDTMTGTPFDKALNDVFLKYGKELRKLRKPFLVTMQAREGQFLACNVCAAGVSIPFDELAQQIAAAAPPPKVAIPPSQETMPPPEIKPAIIKTNSLPQTASSNTVAVPVIEITDKEPAPAAAPQTNTTMTATQEIPTAAPQKEADPSPIVIPTNAPAAIVSNEKAIQKDPSAVTQATNAMPQMPVQTNKAEILASSPITSAPPAQIRNEAVLESTNSKPQITQVNPGGTNAASIDARPKTNTLSAFRPKSSTQTSLAKGSQEKTSPTKPIPNRTENQVKPEDRNFNMARWIIGGIITVLLVTVASVILRKRRTVNQASFISRGIERNLR